MTDINSLAVETAKLEDEVKAKTVILNQMREELLKALQDSGEKNVKVDAGTFSLSTRQNKSLDDEGMEMVKRKPFSSGYWKNTVDMSTVEKDELMKSHIICSPTTSVKYTPKK